MPSGNEKRTNFFRPTPEVTVRKFANDPREVHPWVQSSVSCLVTRVNHEGALEILLCLPYKVREREGVDMLRVPVQGRLQPIVDGGPVDPLDGAREVLWNKANLSVRIEDFRYLGFSYTDRYVEGGRRIKNGKLLHFVHAALPPGKQIVPRTEYAVKLEWHRVEVPIIEVLEAGMRPRKLQAVMKALSILAAEHTVHTPQLQAVVQFKRS